MRVVNGRLRRAEIVPWLDMRIEYWDDMADRRGWPDWAFAPSIGFLRTLCRVLRTHQAVDSHCGRPEHRYCWKCREKMPNAPLRKDLR